MGRRHTKFWQLLNKIEDPWIIPMINAIARNLFTKKDYTKEDIPGIQTPISKFFDSVKSNIPECSELKKDFARYTFVFWILSARQLCPRLQHIYPDLESLQISGHLTNPERVKLEKYEKMDRNLSIC